MQQSFRWVAKLPPSDPGMRAMMRELQVEKKETEFYKRVLPIWQGLANGTGIDFNFCLSPYSECDNEGSLIIMENMNEAGYRDALDKTKGLGLTYSEVVMEEVAKFHALGYAMIASEGDIESGIIRYIRYIPY